MPSPVRERYFVTTVDLGCDCGDPPVIAITGPFADYAAARDVRVAVARCSPHPRYHHFVDDDRTV